MVVCENCRKREASVGCVLCRRNLCGECYEDHMLRISADMDEGYAGMAPVASEEDQPVVCEVCGAAIESAKKDDHLFEVHGISI